MNYHLNDLTAGNGPQRRRAKSKHALAWTGILASAGFLVLLFSADDLSATTAVISGGSAAARELSSQHRVLAAPPASNDVVPNEYVVTIRDGQFAYPQPQAGYCYANINGLFYAQDSVGRCYRFDLNNGGQSRQTPNGVEYCGEGMSFPSNAIDTGSYSGKYNSYQYRFSNGADNGCPTYNVRTGGTWPNYTYEQRQYKREIVVTVRQDPNLSGEPTVVVTEPSACRYRITMTLPYCSYSYTDDSTYEGDIQAGDILLKHGGTLLTTYQRAIHGFAATLTSAQANDIGNDYRVSRIEPNYKVYARQDQLQTPNRQLLETGFDNQEDQMVFSKLQRDIQLQEQMDMNWFHGRNMEVEDNRDLAIVYFNLKDTPGGNWGLERISSRGKRSGTYIYFHDAEDIDVYFLDTGINQAHQQFTKFVNGTQVSRIGNGVVCTGQEGDIGTHGTMVASLASGATYGAGRMTIVHPVQVLDTNGEGSVTSLLCGMEWLINEQKAYANNSTHVGSKRSVATLALGTDGQSDTLDEATKQLVDNGVTAIIAAGNNNANACNYSPYTPDAITVGAVDDLMGSEKTPRSSFSNYGSCLDLFAPGTSLKGAGSGTAGFAVMDGTSMAAGLVAGAASLFAYETSPEEDSETGIEYTGALRPKKIKKAMMRKAEKDAILNAGSGSPNYMTQTTASMCKTDADCPPGEGLVCMVDGSCKPPPPA